MSDLTQLERKLHGYQVILWDSPTLKQTFEAVTDHDDNDNAQNEADEQEQRPPLVQVEQQPYGAKTKTGSEACGVSKSSVYKAYVDMCHCEGRPTLFTRAVVGKMVKRAFPDVRTKRRGPRGRVTQHYIGLRPIISCSTRHSPPFYQSTSEVERNGSVAIAIEPKPDTAAEPCSSPSVSLLEPTQIDAACATAEHFDEGIGSNHRAAGHDEEEVDGDDDQAPGLSGSGVPQAGAAVQFVSASRSSHSHSFSTTPTSSVDSTSSTTIWAPFLPSTLAAMGGLAPAIRQPAPAQHIPLETLESLWDWRHEAPSDFETWPPSVIDTTTSSEPTTQANGSWPPLPVKWAGVERGGCEMVEDLESLLAWSDVTDDPGNVKEN
ncbi:uncharacterized protein ACA1_054600 [Acanthamoeba castellanii str. Neff]|uniref:RFX-type winged-helix domain-containing protein n=1 Tax=Acanthamoeba castellanii (strain ATCC 30010 / Neff) TaxID=1257118 RepID=L8H5D3_ACACF|nr:uncharacterized protein ACA1_054600 [Acanthamoeba castellanii str. Neff]ELR20714.1 hypothetical protein ACA1_054600 [Acanthamoeba castellanii str. Neff]